MFRHMVRKNQLKAVVAYENFLGYFKIGQYGIKVKVTVGI